MTSIFTSLSTEITLFSTEIGTRTSSLCLLVAQLFGEQIEFASCFVESFMSKAARGSVGVGETGITTCGTYTCVTLECGEFALIWACDAALGCTVCRGGGGQWLFFAERVSLSDGFLLKETCRSCSVGVGVRVLGACGNNVTSERGEPTRLRGIGGVVCGGWPRYTFCPCGGGQWLFFAKRVPLSDGFWLKETCRSCKVGVGVRVLGACGNNVTLERGEPILGGACGYPVCCCGGI